MSRIVIFHTDAAVYRDALGPRVPGDEVVAVTEEGKLRREMPTADILLTFHFPLDVLETATNLRWIQVTSAGTEFLAAAHAQLATIAVTNTRGLHADPIADYVMTAAVMLHSDFAEFGRQQARRQWSRRPVETLHGKTLGVLGVGAIGQEIARRGRAAGMEVIGLRRSGAADSDVAQMYALDGLQPFLARCDFLAVTVPMTAQTQALIGARELAGMKRSAYVINVARGGVIDEDALIDALRAGTLAGACLDVFAIEPLPADSPLWTMGNVIITPHIAGMRSDYTERLLDIFVENLAHLRAGTPMRNRVDLARGY